MVSDASSISSFSSLDNVSRSSMLRRQREAALRRRQNQVTARTDSLTDGRRPNTHRMSSMTTSAMADVLAWEEAKTKERIEARIKEEEIQRVEDARKRAEMARAAEAEAEAARKAELERLERERNVREETARRREVEERRFEEARAEAERLEKERLADETAKRAELERLEKELQRERLEKERLADEAANRAELERLEKELQRERLEKERLAAAAREKLEVDRLAEHGRLLEQQSLESGLTAPFRGSYTDNHMDQTYKNTSFQKPSYPSNNECTDGSGTRVTAQQVPPSQTVPPSQMTQQVPEHQSQEMTTCSEEHYGQIHSELAGSNNGYQRYLSSFHQPVPSSDASGRVEQQEDATIISELTDINSPENAPILPAEENASLTTQRNPEIRLSKMKRSISTRSLSFQESNELDNQDAKQSKSSKEDNSEKNSTKDEGALSTKQIMSIEEANLDDPNVMRSFLMKPCPKGEGMTQCCIRRNKGIKNALFPEYRIYLKRNNSKTETFLMTSKKRVGNKTSNYLISMSRNVHDKNSDNILGKLRSNFLGTEYVIYDHGKNPDYDDSYYDEKNCDDIRCELGAILYAASTSLGAKGPRKMRACISSVDDGGNPLKVWQPNKDDERMATCFKNETADIDKLVCLENKPPSWNDEVGAYVLNFNGRVTMASVKNFQLCEQDDEQKQIMQFGRIGKDEFSLDVQWPMSPFQAFAVALSSFDSKLGCD
mmetsp:Transcript_28981/g.61255  ORF Transcript_28981/g.61255 Transcript_28981/m.61255 type:complete len:720 (+) Transcript_28981:1092-3251(+)